MAAKSTFTVDPKACADFMRTSPAIAEALTEIGKAIKDKASSLVPVNRDRRRFRGTLVVGKVQQTDTSQKIEVGSTSSFWHFIEFGSINNEPYRPLSRAAQTITDATWEAS